MPYLCEEDNSIFDDVTNAIIMFLLKQFQPNIPENVESLPTLCSIWSRLSCLPRSCSKEPKLCAKHSRSSYILRYGQGGQHLAE